MRYVNIQLEKRQTVSWERKILNPILFVFLGFVFSSLFILKMGFNPILVFSKMISYSFMNIRGINGSITAGLPLMLCGLSVSVAFKMNLNNIGAEGQYAMGAIAGGGFALFGPALPMPLRLIVMFLVCAAGGALWAMIAAVLKAKWNVSETIVTLMLNYIALLFMDYLCYGPWMAKGQTTAITDAIPEGMMLPNIGNTIVNSGILVAILMAVILYIFYKQTTGGYQIEVIKHNLKSAEYAGINVKKYIVLVLALSGAIAGLAGFVQITGVVHRVQAQLPGGSGYTGIVIAYLSQFNPLAVIIVSILFGGLENSCAAVQIMGVPSQIATMIQGSIMIFVIAGEFFNRYRVMISGVKKQERVGDK
ncbi:MAG: ABC transporter permease [Lachnospiraceae bacterium]|nr:ABC transporter permease [Lachnospiraceae bacterium]